MGGEAVARRVIVATVSLQLESGKKTDKYIRELALRLGRGGEARVGFLEKATYPAADGGMNVAQVAFWDEFGTDRAPPRPYFRNMIEDQMPTWARKLGIAIPFSGYRSTAALEIVAADIKGHLIESINLLQDPPLAPFTIEKKGFAKPLIDTAVMIRSIDWVVTAGTPTS